MPPSGKLPAEHGRPLTKARTIATSRLGEDCSQLALEGHALAGCPGSQPAHGVPEYWVVDCAAETVEVHRGPGPDGYRDVRLVTGQATLSPQAFSDVELSTAEIFA